MHQVRGSVGKGDLLPRLTTPRTHMVGENSSHKLSSNLHKCTPSPNKNVVTYHARFQVHTTSPVSLYPGSVPRGRDSQYFLLFSEVKLVSMPYTASEPWSEPCRQENGRPGHRGWKWCPSCFGTPSTTPCPSASLCTLPMGLTR